MEQKPIVLYFNANSRAIGTEESKIIAHLHQPPPNTALVVFPHRDYFDVMNQEGWYLVRITFHPSGRVAFATPVGDKTTVEVIRDLADVAVTL